MSRKKEIRFDPDRLVLPPADLYIVRLADVGLTARNELARQSSEGLVCGYCQIVVDGKPIKEDGLFAIQAGLKLAK
jgi:hypothetical protein